MVRNHPMLRMLPPTLLGVFLGHTIYEHTLNVPLVPLTIVLVGVFLLVLLSSKLIRKNIFFRFLFFSSVFFSLLVFSCLRTLYYRQQQHVVWPNASQTFMAVLTTAPKTHDKSVSFDVYLVPNVENKKVRRIQLYFERSEDAMRLGVGDVVAFRTIIKQYANRGNPDEFNNKRFQEVRGMQGVAYVPKHTWKKCNYDIGELPLPLWDKLRLHALKLREHWIGIYHEAGMDDEELAFYSALTLGDKTKLSSEIRDDYAKSGVSHILALSGMHLSFLVVFFSFVLSKWRWRTCLRCYGVLAILILVWIYVLITGCPVSLVRSAIMYSLMLLGVLLNRQGFSLNSLCVSAFVMLMLSPNLLYDLGFQLSYLSMLGILIVMPMVTPLFRLRSNRWIEAIGQSMLMTFSAQLFTVPLVLYVFGSFSFVSAFATLLVTPITALLLYCMPVVLLISWACSSLLPYVMLVLKALITVQNTLVGCFASFPFTIEGYLSIKMLLACYVLIFMLVSLRYSNYVSSSRRILMGVTLFIGMFLYDRNTSKIRSQIVFYNNPELPALHIIVSEKVSYLFPANGAADMHELSYIADTFWKKRLHASPIICASNCKNEDIYVREGIINVRDNLSVVMLTDDRWRFVKGSEPLNVDYMYVADGYKGVLTDLASLFRPDCVVLDASLPTWKRKELMASCEQMGWDFYDMNVKGALKVIIK